MPSREEACPSSGMRYIEPLLRQRMLHSGQYGRGRRHSLDAARSEAPGAGASCRRVDVTIQPRGLEPEATRQQIHSLNVLHAVGIRFHSSNVRVNQVNRPGGTGRNQKSRLTRDLRKANGCIGLAGNHEHDPTYDRPKPVEKPNSAAGLSNLSGCGEDRPNSTHPQRARRPGSGLASFRNPALPSPLAIREYLYALVNKGAMTSPRGPAIRRQPSEPQPAGLHSKE